MKRNLNRHGIPVFGVPRRPWRIPDIRHDLLYVIDGVVATRERDVVVKHNRQPSYLLEDVVLDAVDDLRLTLRREQLAKGVAPKFSLGEFYNRPSFNTRPSQPVIPVIKGARYLGSIPAHRRLEFQLAGFGHTPTRTGRFAGH